MNCTHAVEGNEWFTRVLLRKCLVCSRREFYSKTMLYCKDCRGYIHERCLSGKNVDDDVVENTAIGSHEPAEETELETSPTEACTVETVDGGPLHIAVTSPASGLKTTAAVEKVAKRRVAKKAKKAKKALAAADDDRDGRLVLTTITDGDVVARARENVESSAEVVAETAVTTSLTASSSKKAAKRRAAKKNKAKILAAEASSANRPASVCTTSLTSSSGTSPSAAATTSGSDGGLLETKVTAVNANVPKAKTTAEDVAVESAAPSEHRPVSACATSSSAKPTVTVGAEPGETTSLTASSSKKAAKRRAAKKNKKNLAKILAAESAFTPDEGRAIPPSGPSEKDTPQPRFFDELKSSTNPRIRELKDLSDVYETTLTYVDLVDNIVADETGLTVRYQMISPELSGNASTTVELVVRGTDETVYIGSGETLEIAQEMAAFSFAMYVHLMLQV